jgi:hypothetical protein
VQTGIAYYPPVLNIISLWIPLSINEIVSFGNHHFELGMGVMPVAEKTYLTPMGSEELMWNVFLTGRVGYRYQKPDGKFLFRAGLTPVGEYSWRAGDLTSMNVHFLPGLSFGYSF